MTGRNRMPRTVVTLAAVAAMTLAGCSVSTIHDVSLPGGADTGDDPYQVQVHFRDVLDLVPQAGVQVNNVAVGQVDSIDLADDDWTAEVTLTVNQDTTLPANAIANVRQSSLLGEKYVELSAPAEAPAEAKLVDGDHIPLSRTNRSVEVEEVLGALSMLLNGGGVEQLNTITEELNQALEGNEHDIKALLRNTDDLVSTLDNQSSDITRALDELNRLSLTLADQRDEIVGAITDLGPGLEVLEQQRGQLVDMLQAFDELSDVAVEVVNSSQEDLVADLETLLPTLRKLGDAGSDLPAALELLFTFPFSDAAAEGAKGDYFNLYASIDLNLEEILTNLGRSRQSPLKDLPIPGGLTEEQEESPDDLDSPLPLSGLESDDDDEEQPGHGPAGPEGILDALSGGVG